MRRTFPMSARLVLAALVVLAAGCGGLKKTVEPNEPPQTTIFVSGPLDTVNHTAHLHWFGTAAHGYIAGYEVRLLNPLAPADTAWRFTLATDSVITVYTPTGYVAPTFEARAIDDHGVRDPSPARQLFQFSNIPPVVTLVGKPNAGDHSDTTFASVTVTWNVTDADGNAAAVVCKVWLDGQAASPLTATGGSFTMPSSRFLVGGAYTSGRRTLYIQGIDDGGMAGPIDSVSWYVKAPVTGSRARLLLIDDVPAGLAYNVRTDTLYSNQVANTGVPSDQVRVLRLESNQPFRSAKDLEQTFKQFEAVVWYRAEQTTYSGVLNSYASGPNGGGIGPYLDAGGKLYIESLSLVEAWSSYGPLKQSFLQKYADCQGTFQFATPPDSSGAWSVTNTGTLYCPSIADSIPSRRGIGSMRAFAVRNASDILMFAPAQMMSPSNPIAMPVAIDVLQPSGGRLILQTYPMVTGTVPASGAQQRASVVLLKTLQRLGLSGP
jgi:hypothetical protein